MMLSLSACGFKWPEWANQEMDPLAFLGSPGTKTKAPPPPVKIPEDAPDQNDPASNHIPSSTMGVNLDTYFVQNIDDPNTRIQRLENVIMAMHQDMQNLTHVTPPQKNNIPVASQQNTVPGETAQVPSMEVEDNDGEDGAWSEPPPMDGVQKNQTPHDQQKMAWGAPQQLHAEEEIAHTAPKLHAEAAYKPAPPPSATDNSAHKHNGKSVSAIRIGEHADKIRIVLDTTSKIQYQADLDNGEKLLIVELTDAQWKSSVSSQIFTKTPILKSFNTTAINNGQGTRLIFQLERSTDIAYQSQYTVSPSSPESKIVLDLAK
jgi:hypothetical protein